jgi:hypothetical protein
MVKTEPLKLTMLCLLSSLLFYFSAQSQDWNPFPDQGTALYSFSQQGSNVVTWLHGVRVESAGVVGGDSVYYFNKINRYMEQSEMVMGCNWPIGGLPDIVLLQRDNYFGNEMHIRSNGDYEFYSTAGDTFLLRTQVPPGSSWNFSSGVQATLDSIVTVSVFGQMDSVMHISLTGMPGLQLSRSHGFVVTPSFLQFVNRNQSWETVTFNLWGLPDMGLGDTLPGNRGVFNFDVGDKFGSYDTYTVIQSGHVTETYSNKVITNKTETAASYNYDWMADRLTITPIPFVGIDTNYTPAVPGSVSHSKTGILDLLPYESTPNPGLSGAVQIGVRIRPTWGNRIEYLFDDIIYYDSCAKVLDRFEDISRHNYMTGLGITRDFYTSPYYTDDWRLYCYETANDSRGPCLDLAALVSVEEGLEESFTLEIGPNPASDVLRAKIAGASAIAPAKWTVFDINGRLVEQHFGQPGVNEIILPLGMYANGIYLLSYENIEGLSLNKKFTVLR